MSCDFHRMYYTLYMYMYIYAVYMYTVYMYWFIVFRTFYSAMEHIERGRNDAKSSSTIFNPDYAVASDFLEAWLNLAEKLINASAILESSHTLPIPPPPASCRHSKKPTHNPLFNPLDFILKTQNVSYNNGQYH